MRRHGGVVRQRAILGAVLGAALVAACGDIPQPFRHDDDGVPRLARPKMTRGVTIRPPEPTPEGRALAEALVRALEEQEVPALVSDVHAFGYVVEGELADGPKGALVRWTLKAPDGTEAARADQPVVAPPPGRDAPVLMKRAALPAAALLARPLDDPDAMPAHAAPAATVEDKRPTASILPLRGLPGDGDKALTEALKRALGRAGLRVKDDGGDYVVEGRVSVTPGRPGEDMVGVVWIVRDGSAGNPELGRINQDGAVPRGRLSQNWGSMARDIAEGGAAGVAQVVLADTGGTGKRKNP